MTMRYPSMPKMMSSPAPLGSPPPQLSTAEDVENGQHPSPWRWGAVPKLSPSSLLRRKQQADAKAAIAAAAQQPHRVSQEQRWQQEEQESDGEDEPHMRYWSLAVISPTNPVRLAGRWLLRRPWFDRSVDVTILINCFTLALRDPTAAACQYSNDAVFNDVLRGLDVVFTSIFVAELGLKLLVNGLWQHPGAYLRDSWNCIDGFVTVISLLGLMPDLCRYLGGLSALRAVRLLRAMKSVPSFGATRAIVQALIDAAPKLVHVGVLLFFIFICFGILGACRAPLPARTARWRGAGLAGCLACASPAPRPSARASLYPPTPPPFLIHREPALHGCLHAAVPRA